MSARVTRKALLLLATSLLLAGCVDNPENNTGSETSGNESNTSIVDNSQGSDNSYTSQESSSKSSIDYTQGWDPKVDAEIRRNLGGNGLPFFELTGEITIVHIDKDSTTNAHMLMTSTCAYDQHLVYKAKTKFELAGWVVSYNNAAQPKDMRVDAVKNDVGITFKMTGRLNSRDGSYYPYIQVYFTEQFNEPVKGTNWSQNTLDILEEIGIVTPHMLPYCYLGAYNDVCTKVNNRRCSIKGGDWIRYEMNILSIARKSYRASSGWAESSGRVTGNGHYKSETYTFEKTFSDGYKITAKLYGDAADGSFSSTSEDDVVAYLDVACTAPRN